jgi:flagellar assembly factor FliW
MFKGPRQVLLPTRQDPDAYPSMPGLVDAAFITLRAGIMGFERSARVQLDAWPLNLDEYTAVRKDNRFAKLGIVALNDGFVLTNVTKSSLEDRSHRLKIPFTGEPNYFRAPYNVDCQAVGSQKLDLTGAEQIGRNTEAAAAILMFERDFVYGALTNWQELRKGSQKGTFFVA